MRCPFWRTATLAWALPLAAVAAPSVAELTLPFGSTLAEATEEARQQTAACAAAGSACRREAPDPRELIGAVASCAGGSAVMAWRHGRELSNGKARAAELTDLALTGQLFGCDATSCQLVVRTNSPLERERDVSTLSVCHVEVVRGVAGAPRRCEEAMMEHPRSGTMLRAQVGEMHVACSMGLRDFDAIFRGRATELAAVRRTIMEVLESMPFNLSVMEDRGAIVGTRKQLASAVLKGWREWVTVRVDIGAAGADAGTTISTTLLVSKQATGDREAWTPPAEALEETYLRTLRDEFRRRGASLSTGGTRP